MLNAKTITSPHNQQVKDAVKLRDRRARNRKKLIIIDGLKETLRAVEAGVVVAHCFVCSAELAQDKQDQISALAHQIDAQFYDLPLGLFQKIAYGESTPEIIAVAEAPHRSLAQMPFGTQSLIGVIESVEKPGNVGAVIRSACGAGLNGIIVADPGTDLFNPNIIRASLGSVFSMPVCAADSQQVLDWLKQHDFQIVAARVDAQIRYDSIDYRQATAFVLGSEARGLSAVWSKNDITPVSIPMVGGIDSLNISASAAVLFYEALRQRS